MVFNVLLYISLGIFILGLIYKVYTWFSLKIGISAQDYTPSQRFSAAVKGTVGVIFSSKIFSLQDYAAPLGFAAPSTAGSAGP